MSEGVAKFMPPDMRTRIVQELIAEMGIRPLSNAIGVNSKTVYRYKFGSSCPTEDTMMRVLAVAKEKNPALFNKYIEELRDNFSVALNNLPNLELQSIEEPAAPVKSQPSEILEQEIRVERPTAATKFTIYEKLGVSNPSDRMKLVKILAIMQGMESFTLSDIAQKSNFTLETIEKYTDMLFKAGYVEKTSDDNHRLAVKVQM
jgi:DNA-binding MarR family transcriptional regulator